MGDAKDSNHIRLVGALAGMGSGLTKVAVGHGFDTIKTRLQCSPQMYRGAFDALFTIVRKEGPLALYKGCTPPAVGWAAIDSVLMGSLHNYRLFLARNGMTEPTPGSGIPRLTMFAHGLAGLAAGITSTFVATPIEHIKVKLQLQSERLIQDRQFKGSIDCIRQIWRIQGPLGLWSGFTGSLLFRSNFFWMFLSFEGFMRVFSSLKGSPYEMSTGTANFMSGGLGAFVYWTMAMPADNIKNRMMSYPYPLPYPQRLSDLGQRPSLWVTARSIYSQHGFLNSSAFFVYEGTLRVLGAEKTRHS